eukprot:266719_1
MSGSNPTDIDALIDDEDQYNDNSSAHKFDLTVVHTNRHVLRNVSPNDTIATIMDLIQKEILNTDKKIDLTAGGVTLKEDKKICDYGFPKASYRANKVGVIFRAGGGSQVSQVTQVEEKKSNNNQNRVRKLDFKKFPDLKKSDKTDCIYHYENVECAEMSCGCAFAPQTMYDYVCSIFDKYSTAYKITCPY